MSIEFASTSRMPSATQSARQLLEDQIREGSLEPGSRLPAEPELADKLGVSRNSLREALRSLEGCGLVTKRHGVGTFVTESRPLVRGGLERLVSITDFIAGEGREPGSVLLRLSTINAGPELERRLCIGGGQEVAVIESLKTADSQPVALCIDYIPTTYLPDGFDAGSLHEAIFEGLQRELGIVIKYAECRIVPATASAALALKLNIAEGAAVLLLDQVHVDERGRRVFHSRSYFPPNRFSFVLIRHR